MLFQLLLFILLLLLFLPLLLLTMPSTDQAGLSPTSPTPVSSGRPVSSLSQVNITIALLLYSQAKTFTKSISDHSLLQPVHSGGPGPVSHSSPRYPPQYLQQVHPKHTNTFENCFVSGRPAPLPPATAGVRLQRWLHTAAGTVLGLPAAC